MFKTTTREKESNMRLNPVKNPKVILVGSLGTNTNKLDLILNFEKCKSKKSKQYFGQQPALGVQLNTLKFSHEKQRISLDVWNVLIRNERRYCKLAPIYMANVQACIGVFTITNRLTWDKMKFWIQKYLDYNLENKTNDKLQQINIYVLAYFDTRQCNNIDKITRQELNDYCKQNNINYYIIHSCCKGTDLKLFFNDFFQDILTKRMNINQNIKTKQDGTNLNITNNHIYNHKHSINYNGSNSDSNITSNKIKFLKNIKNSLFDRLRDLFLI